MPTFRIKSTIFRFDALKALSSFRDGPSNRAAAYLLASVQTLGQTASVPFSLLFEPQARKPVVALGVQK
jgi:hypothetical protein